MLNSSNPADTLLLEVQPGGTESSFRVNETFVPENVLDNMLPQCSRLHWLWQKGFALDFTENIFWVLHSFENLILQVQQGEIQLLHGFCFDEASIPYTKGSRGRGCVLEKIWPAVIGRRAEYPHEFPLDGKVFLFQICIWVDICFVNCLKGQSHLWIIYFCFVSVRIPLYACSPLCLSHQ